MDKVLIASARPAMRERLADLCLRHGCEVLHAGNGADALWSVTGDTFLVLLDRELPDLQAPELAAILRQRAAHVDVAIADDEGMPRLTAPALNPQTCRVLGLEEATHESEDGEEAPLPGMMGESAGARLVYRMARMVAPVDAPVLLTGETGTGKELVARAIHELSPRARRPFVVMNCAAIPETLIESELFGHTRGAFTGAVQAHIGRLQAAHGGTLLLDEVGELPPAMQAKLLRFLQEGEVQRLGSSEPVRVDVRVVAATNADLVRMAANGSFRQDLYYRLLVFPIELPPLRERRDDIVPLAEHFLADCCRRMRLEPKALTEAAASAIAAYHWPGNIRELRHAVERAVILAGKRSFLIPEYFLMRSSQPNAPFMKTQS